MASSINASTSGAGGVITTADNTGILNIQTAGTNAVTVDASQNVIVNDTVQSGSAKLTVKQTVDTTIGGVAIVATDGNGANLSRLTDGALTFRNGGAERMRIASTGDILFGKTALDVTNPGVWFEPTSINYGRFNFIKGTASGTGATSTLAFYYNGSQIGSIQNTSTATSYVTSSDYRLKENIAPMTGALDKVAQLKPVTYKWKVDGADGQGFIAHELQAIVPDCVIGEKDAVDEEGNIKPQGIDTSFLVATLTAAIQELTERVIALENK